MNFMKKNWSGILVCLVIAIPSWLLGKAFPVAGGPVIAIIAGMIVTMFWNNKGKAEPGIKWTSKVILQTAVVLLGFGMNLGVIRLESSHCQLLSARSQHLLLSRGYYKGFLRCRRIHLYL